MTRLAGESLRAIRQCVRDAKTPESTLNKAQVRQSFENVFSCQNIFILKAKHQQTYEMKKQLNYFN